MNNEIDVFLPMKGRLYAFFDEDSFDEDHPLIMYEEFDRVMLSGNYLTESANTYTGCRALTINEWRMLGAPIN